MPEVKDKRIRINFHIHPYRFEEKQHAVEKADSNNKKRRYLYGITSGMKVDGTGERMTANCIKNMQKQANSGEILLYEGQHGVTHTEDLGRLVESQITPMGDWVTTYRLYDENDDIGPVKLERANTLWKQVNGLPPYEKALQKGFSIEGFIPDGGIIHMSDTGQRTIDKVDLDGVLVTPRPAYEDSVLLAVCKALDILPEQKRETETERIKLTFSSLLEDDERERNFYTQSYKLEEMRDDLIEKIMTKGIQVKDRLEIVFDEYKNLMIQLLMDYKDIFSQIPADQPAIDMGSVDIAKMKTQRLKLWKHMNDLITQFYGVKKSIKRSKSNGRNSHSSLVSRRKTTH